ncbi:MAG TPA: FlgD immunoglobulin-like domain containing protein [Candidatus Krumholzibacteria bacterium]|nr:FlgD immunoglobulin-like domain containing protein [Candidatus Krumholzibacteria bacterium]
MSRSTVVHVTVWIVAVLVLGPARASVHDIHLYTDSTPDFTSIEDFVATATSTWDDPEDQAIALWRWMVRSHLQTSATFEDGAPVWDPIRFYSSYPNTYCGFMAAYLTAFVDVMGGDWRHRYVELADHTVCEISWDAGATWHMFDTSMVMYARRHDGTIASCADIAAPGSCDLSRAWGDDLEQAGHLYLYHGAPECVTNPPDANHTGEFGHPSGYRKATDNPVPYARTLRNGADSYVSGFSVQTAFTHVRHGWRNRLHLRPGHVYTRYGDPLGSGSEYARLNTRGGDPNRGDEALQIRSNGRWEIEPDTNAADPRGGWYELDGVVHRDDDGGTGPALRPAAGVGEARLVTKVDASNVITSAHVHVEGIRGAGDQATLEISRDAGRTWIEVAVLSEGSFATDVPLSSDVVGGAFELLVGVRLVPDATRQDCGIDALWIEAITQVNRLALPRLQRGTNRVRFRAGPPQETLTLLPSLHAGAEHHGSGSAEDWSGVTSLDNPVTYSSPALVPSTSGTPGFVTWRFDVPTDIVGFTFGGSLITRSATADDRIRLRSSWNGIDFETLEVFDASTAPTWDARVVASPSTVPPGMRSVWLQYELESSVAPSSQSTGVQEALLQVHHEPHDTGFDPVEVTWCWTEHRTEGDVTRRHTRVVRTAEETWTLNVAGHRHPTVEWIRMRLADGSTVEGYDDGIDVGPGHGYDKVRIDAAWIDDVALARPYTVSRPAGSTNPDTDGRELTDGTVIPPTDYASSSVVQGQVAYWDGDDPLTVTVDLGAEQTIEALRVTSHAPNIDYAHAGTIRAIAVAGDGSETPLGVIQHDDVFSPVGTHLDWGRVHSLVHAGLPAGGRLAHGFWLVFDTPTTAREVRLDVVPLAGHGVGLSEIAVYSEVQVSDWPDREVDLGGTVVAVDDVPSTVPRDRLRVAPNPSNPATVVTYDLPEATHVALRVVDVRGRVVRTLVDGWRPAGSHRARWDGRDDRGRSVASGRYFAVGEWTGTRKVGDITLVR